MTAQLFPSDPVNPRLTVARVHAVLEHDWGADGELSDLGSMQDQNYRVRGKDGVAAVVKIAGRHTAAGGIDLQNAAMRHVAAHADRHFSSPEPVRAADGRETVEVDGHLVRLLSWVDGTPLADRSYVAAGDLFDLGALAARVAAALRGFDHPLLDTGNVWDIRNAAAVLEDSAPSMGDEWQVPLSEAIAAFRAVPDELPTIVAHGDVTPVNVVTLDDGLHATPVGVLDFGDVMCTWRVGDVVAAAVGALEHPGTGDTLESAVAVLRGYHSVTSLTEAEAEAFWPLLIARAALTAAVCHRQLARNPDNAYAQAGVESGLRAMRRVAEVPPALARAAARAAIGVAPVAHGADARQWLSRQELTPLIADLDPSHLVVADLSPDSELFAHGEWEVPDAMRELLSDVPVVLRWNEPRLTSSLAPSLRAPTTLHLGVDVVVPFGTAVQAPLAATVHAITADGVDLRVYTVDNLILIRLSGISPTEWVRVGEQIESGQIVGTVVERNGTLPPHVHVQVMLADGLPECGLPAHHEAWAALCPDPSLLIGVDAAAPARSDAATLLRSREQVVARPQHLYYDRAVEFVRGWRHHLYDADGRCYLDMINNIAAVGHSHPRVTAAAVRQFRKLNTNSRFLYESMTRYCERIAELLPPGLDRVFLVNSGSEAADLALQLARRHTGRSDIVALAGAYHGWTGSVIDVSTSPMDRPNWRAELAPGVHIAEQPDTYRGAHGADAIGYRASVRAACADADQRGGAAAFICEPLLGNQGALELPAGYLQGAYEDVRAAGGLCIADEVQVGMARTGDTFWAFEREGVVPDIVFTAKATGNGHPLGVVVCSSTIADDFDGKTAYFSSTGGGPVSCEIGLSVLDVIRDENLQENARLIGALLRQQLLQLANKYELIGAVHGRGLYQGIDLVRDQDTKEPATREALLVSERLRSVGVVMQPTGDAFNVLKVKPPLCLDIAGADFFVTALDAVLSELV